MDGGRRSIREAVEYIQHVKRIIPEKYDEFIQILKDVRAHRLDEAGGKARVKELIKRHPRLLLGFNYFFPGAEITIQPEAKEMIVFEDAKFFLVKLKARFQGHDSHVYTSFVAIMQKYSEGNMSIELMKYEILRLLQGHQDLIDRVSLFFPRDS